MKALEWSAPNHGVQHLGKPGDIRWATVNDFSGCAKLVMWFSGCGFKPKEQIFENSEDARKAGYAWVVTTHYEQKDMK